MTRITIVIAAALVLAALLPTAPAHALRARVFVSKAGADSGGCSFSAPCQSLDFALNAVEPSGEITILDSGGYNPITITQGVTITVPPGVEAGIAVPSGGTGITINAPGASVTLRGLTLEGAATGRTGIVFNHGAELEIIDCVIQNFTQTGAYIDPDSPMKLLISNTRVMDNPTAGIDLVPVAGGYISATIDRVTVNSNGYGIFSTNGPGGLEADIINSVIDYNLNGGIAVTSPGPFGAYIAIKNSTVSHYCLPSGCAAISVSDSGGGSFMLLSHSLIAHNGTGIAISGPAAIVSSAGDNDMYDNNTPISGGTLHSIPKQ